MSLHPFIDLQVGDEKISSVPPEYIESITYKSSIDSLSSVDFDVVDPSFSKLEQLIILADSSDRPIICRFGYIDPATGQAASNWIQSRLLRYSPTLDNKGMRIVASCVVDVGLRFVNAKSTVYAGKISAVVIKIAKDLGLDFDVEETNDNDNEADEDHRGHPTEWRTEGLPLLDFIRQKLLPLAVSKSGKGNYNLYVTGSRSILSKKPILHFHTFEFKECDSRNKKTKVFNYLANQSDSVIEFKPEFNSTGLGNLCGSQTVMRAVDPVTKQFVLATQNSETNPGYVGVGKGNRTNTKTPPSSAGSEGTEGQGGFHLVQERLLSEATNRSKVTWTLLKSFSLTATLSLVGLPATADIEANDLININVLIPDKASGSYRQHWSGGAYLVTEAIHQIGPQYTVDCQLKRDYNSVGATEVTTARLAVDEALA